MTKVVLMLPDEPRDFNLAVSLVCDGVLTKSYYDSFKIAPGDEVKLYIHENV